MAAFLAFVAFVVEMVFEDVIQHLGVGGGGGYKNHISLTVSRPTYRLSAEVFRFAFSARVHSAFPRFFFAPNAFKSGAAVEKFRNKSGSGTTASSFSYHLARDISQPE